MKKTIILLLMISLPAVLTRAQITIDQTDMPAPGDTLRVSLTNQVPDGYSKTAMDTAWNFSILEAVSQRIDTFVNATATPLGYQLFFVTLGGANLASPRGGIPIPVLPFTNGFNFYKNSANSFSDLGTAYTFQGIPLPLKYDVPDKIYQFPMPPSSSWSSLSSVSLPVPSVAYYGTTISRSNVADGWGTLTTPFGTFETIRIKSTVQAHDSIFIDSLQIGFSFDRNYVEYKWLGKDQGIPLLTIHEEGAMVNATWRDFPRMPAYPLSIDLGPDTSVAKGATVTLREATVTGGTPPYNIFWNTLDTGHTIVVQVMSDTSFSALVVDALMNVNSATRNISLRYPPGVAELLSGALKIYPNPATGRISINVPDQEVVTEMQVLSLKGVVVKSFAGLNPVQSVSIDLTDLPDGHYILTGKAGTKSYSGKLQILRRPSR